MNASNFYFTEVYLKNDFEFILSRIYECYELMLDKYDSIDNNENLIRNRLHKDYLDNNDMRDRLKMQEYLFDTEIEIIGNDYKPLGRTDIKVYNAVERTKDTNAYYIIECKRLDGTNTLNKAYRQNGINRYIEGKYPVYKNMNGMLGFVIENIDIKNNSETELQLNPINFISNFNYSYTSNHTTKKGEVNFTLYHLMLDFSNKIN